MLTLSSHTFHGLQPLDLAYFKPFKVVFRAYKNAWAIRNHEAKVGKEDLASWIGLALNRTFTRFNIKVAGFKAEEIYLFNLNAMQSKMGPSEGFLSRIIVELKEEDQHVFKIMDEGIPPPLPNSIHFYVDAKIDDAVEDVDLSQEDPPTVIY